MTNLIAFLLGVIFAELIFFLRLGKLDKKIIRNLRGVEELNELIEITSMAINPIFKYFDAHPEIAKKIFSEIKQKHPDLEGLIRAEIAKLEPPQRSPRDLCGGD